MQTLIVAYDLNREVIRPKITHEVKKTTWAKLSESSYAIVTSETAQDVFDRFKPLLDENDNLYVIPVTKPFAGYGPRPVIEWLESNVSW